MTSCLQQAEVGNGSVGFNVSPQMIFRSIPIIINPLKPFFEIFGIMASYFVGFVWICVLCYLIFHGANPVGYTIQRDVFWG